MNENFSMQNAVNEKERIIEIINNFNFKDVKIYPEDEEQCLSLIVNTEPDRGNTNLCAALEVYLSKTLGYRVTVSPISLINNFHVDRILNLCVDFDESEIKKAYDVSSLDEIKFTPYEEDDADKLQFFVAKKHLENIIKDERSNLGEKPDIFFNSSSKKTCGEQNLEKENKMIEEVNLKLKEKIDMADKLIKQDAELYELLKVPKVIEALKIKLLKDKNANITHLDTVDQQANKRIKADHPEQLDNTQIEIDFSDLSQKDVVSSEEKNNSFTKGSG